MKSAIKLFLGGLFALCVALAVPASAQAPAASSDIVAQLAPPTGPGGISSDQVVQWLTPVLVPLLIAGVKKLLPQVPSWVLPILAPVLGVVIEVVNTAISNHPSNWVLAILLGLAGVGVREVKDQLKPA